MANRKKTLSKKGISGIKEWIIGLVIITFITFLLYSFAANFVAVSNPESPAVGKFNSTITRMNSSLHGFNSMSEEIKEDFSKSEPSPLEYVQLILLAAWSVPKTIFLFALSGITDLSRTLFEGIGINSGMSVVIILGVGILVSGLAVIFVLQAIKYIRQGYE